MKLGESQSHIDRRITLGTVACILLLAGGGCGAVPVPEGGGSAGSPDAFLATSDPPTPAVDAETGDTVASTIVDDSADAPFDSYRVLPLTSGTTATLDGELGTENQVDVYNLGAIEAGDQLRVSVEGRDALDPVLGIFDAHGDDQIVNDDRNFYGGDLDPVVDFRTRRTTDACYVAVAPSPGSHSTGRYHLSVLLRPGGEVPPPRPQLVYLNFDGGETVVIGRREPVEIPPFEGSLIGREFAAQTDELIERTVALMRQDYIGLDVTFVSSRESPEPVEPHTTVHFGSYDRALLGISDYVDEFNESTVQKAIVFVDTFQVFLQLNPSVEEMAGALANVGSHETGHLLGLNHTSDPLGIMDIDANLRQMLANQGFRVSPLHPEVFPIGHQNAPLLLFESVGGDLALAKSAAEQQLKARDAWYDQGEPLPARLSQPFSACGCPVCIKHRFQRVQLPAPSDDEEQP